MLCRNSSNTRAIQKLYLIAINEEMFQLPGIVHTTHDGSVVVKDPDEAGSSRRYISRKTTHFYFHFRLN